VLFLARGREGAGDGDEHDFFGLEFCVFWLGFGMERRVGERERCTLAGVVLGREAADLEVEGARRRDVGEGDVRGEGGAGGEGGHFGGGWVVTGNGRELRCCEVVGAMGWFESCCSVLESW
jgi:hypothetical protein